MDFEESTEEIAPLSEEEAKTKLEALRQRAAEKRKVQSEEDKVAAKRNEAILRKSTREQQDAKEQLQAKEMIKEAEAKRKEKLADIDAKKRIQAKIAADKEERRLKAEREKAQRAGQPLPEQSAPTAAPVTASAPKPASAYTEARLRLQTSGGTVQKTFSAETTLFEVAHAVSQENGTEVQSLTSNFPRKTWDRSDFGMTLKEAGMVPSAALIVK